MKINVDTVYHVPTPKLRKHFLEQCQIEGFVWNSRKMPTERLSEEMYGEHTCIAISETGRMGFGRIQDFMCNQNIISYTINPAPQIIKFNGLKIVYNPPYTIVTDGKFTGKAKCNPADEYDPVEGLRIAAERFEEAKKPEKVGFTIGDKVRITGNKGMWHDFSKGDTGVVLEIDPHETGLLLIGKTGGIKQYVDRCDYEHV
jgi:hypothetical protein